MLFRSGLRVYNGQPVFLAAHLDRLFEGAKAIALDIGLTREQLAAAIRDTLSANGMTDGVHLRLMITRGVKRTPYQDPRVTIGPATVVIIPEFSLLWLLSFGSSTSGKPRRTCTVNSVRPCASVSGLASLNSGMMTTVAGPMVTRGSW